jgi:serine/threonine protein kinase
MQVAMQILEQVALMHAKGFIHGDIKASNIIWSAWKFRWMLIDFAGARRINHVGHFSTTAEFSGPETLVRVLTRKEFLLHFTRQLDIYGVAAMLWTVLTDIRPFQPLFDRNLFAHTSADTAVQLQVRPLRWQDGLYVRQFDVEARWHAAALPTLVVAPLHVATGFHRFLCLWP